MVATPTLGTQSTSLVRLGIADGDVCFQLACRVGFQCCEEIGLVVLVEPPEDVLESDIPGRLAPLRMVDIVNIESWVRLVVARQ
ncbi:hypothetical protein D9M72_606030 [compost metagenome]